MPKKITYDRYYQTPDLFGAPYPIWVEFFKQHPHKGRDRDGHMRTYKVHNLPKNFEILILNDD